MRGLKVQFFVSYAIFGSIGPLLPVFLKELKGFTEFEIGVNQAMASLATILSPILVTLLADLRVDSRRILTWAFLLSAVWLGFFMKTSGVVPTLFFYMLYSLAFIPTIALQDGYYFALSKQHAEQGKRDRGYHRVRVWGTVGFIVPSLALYVLLLRTGDLATIVWCGICSASLSALHAFRLPRLNPLGPQDLRSGTWPTVEALKVLLGPKGRFFCLSLVLAFAASSAYHGFFSLYLKTHIGVDPSLIGLIINLGVFIEIFYLLALGRLQARFGLRKLMLFGFLASLTRFCLLAFVPSLLTSIAIQFLHGAEIVAILVLPVMYINQLAGDRFRNSIQGAYTMVVIGFSRVAGWLIAGMIARIDYFLLFAYAAVLVGIAWVLTFLFFHPEDPAST